MNAPAEPRTLLKQLGLIRAPGVFDGRSAHLVRSAGFPVAYLTGAGVSVSGYGLPGIGEVTDVVGIFGLVGPGEWLKFSERYR